MRIASPHSRDRKRRLVPQPVGTGLCFGQLHQTADGPGTVAWFAADRATLAALPASATAVSYSQ